MSAPNAVRRQAWVEATHRQDVPRCGVCDQPSARPLCHRCEAVAQVTAERFGSVDELERERRP